MASIKDAARLTKRAMLTDMYIGGGITTLLEGTFGIGKSTVAHEIAKSLNGMCMVADGSTIKEGEFCGMPYVLNNTDGEAEERFVPYYTTARIKQLQRRIYEKAKTTGFLNGTVKLNEDGSTTYEDETGKHVIPAVSEYEKVILGEDNCYSFGENLPGKIKLQLLTSKEIMSIVLFIDEMNRTDNATMREFMNVVLNRVINGYKLPWWVFIMGAINPCDQDSVFSTNELDPAQRDRFLKLKCSASFDEWADWAFDNGINGDYISALGSSTEFFVTEGKGYDSTDEAQDQQPSPRSHVMCAMLYSLKDEISRSGFFTPEEIKCADDDVRSLIIGKIGNRAGRTILSALNNKENYINPKDLLTGKSAKISDSLEAKLKGMKTLQKRLIAKAVLKYLSNTAAAYYFDRERKGLSEDDKKKANETWKNIISQLKSFLNTLDGSTMLMFAKEASTTKVNLDKNIYPKYVNEKTLFTLVCTTFNKDVYEQILMNSNISSTGELDQK